MDLLFKNGTLLPMTASGDEPLTVEAALGISGNRIALLSADPAEISAFEQGRPDLRVIDCRGKLLMPGLINTHCHTAMTLQRSYADDIALMEWLNDYIWPFESLQTTEDVQLGMELGIAEMLLGGTTSFVDMYFHEPQCKALVERTGIRALLGSTYFDRNADEVLGEMEQVLAADRPDPDGRVHYAIAAHAPYTCSRENILRGKELARKYGLMFEIHAAETEDEERIIASQWGMRPIPYLDSIGVLDEKTIAAHCIHVDGQDIATLVKRGVTVSHNPQSNMKISSGIAPIEEMRRQGARVTVATDGVCSNNDLDLFEELRSAVFLQKSATGSPLAMPAYEALKMITANGARAMGRADGELGVLRVGALADVVVIDLQKPHLQPVHNLVSNLVYCGKAADVESVVIDGRIVVENRRIKGIDLEDLYVRINRAAHRISAQIRK